jgi:uncharacterized protein
MTALILALGLAAGLLVGLLGIGGGVALVPAMVYLLHLDQHTAQGTSLFLLLPPIGLGALREYWKQGQVDLRAGVVCAGGMAVGAYAGSRIAIPIPSRHLEGMFGCFLMVVALLLWGKTHPPMTSPGPAREVRMNTTVSRDAAIFAVAAVCGVASGMFGIGGGTLLVPFLALFFGFDQHRAQGTSLVALIPPTGLFALLAYAHEGFVHWNTGLLLLPGVFVGGILGGKLAETIRAGNMRRIFAALLFVLGCWQVTEAWFGKGASN